MLKFETCLSCDYGPIINHSCETVKMRSTSKNFFPILPQNANFPNSDHISITTSHENLFPEFGEDWQTITHQSEITLDSSSKMEILISDEIWNEIKDNHWRNPIIIVMFKQNGIQFIRICNKYK